MGSYDLLIGAFLLASGLVLLFLGMPRGGESPKFLQFSAALSIYPILILALLVLGAAELITGFMSAR